MLGVGALVGGSTGNVGYCQVEERGCIGRGNSIQHERRGGSMGGSSCKALSCAAA